MRNVIVTEYQKDWKEKFRVEAEKIKQIYGDRIIDIHHIGSTSVKDLKAKPIIDIMPIVRNIEEIDTFNEQMVTLGYECCGELGIPGRRYFRKGGDRRTHHVHMFQVDNYLDVNRHLAVRDYLRENEQMRESYGELKASLAKQHPTNMDAYINGKDEFVKKLEREALSYVYRRRVTIDD